MPKSVVIIISQYACLYFATIFVFTMCTSAVTTFDMIVDTAIKKNVVRWEWLPVVLT